MKLAEKSIFGAVPPGRAPGLQPWAQHWVSAVENQSCDEIRSWSRAGEMVCEAECQSFASVTAKWVSLKSSGSWSCLQMSGICLGSPGPATKAEHWTGQPCAP